MARRVLYPMIFLYTWPMQVGCSIEAKLWLISKTISNGKANKSSQRGIAINFTSTMDGMGECLHYNNTSENFISWYLINNTNLISWTLYHPTYIILNSKSHFTPTSEVWLWPHVVPDFCPEPEVKMKITLSLQPISMNQLVTCIHTPSRLCHFLLKPRTMNQTSIGTHNPISSWHMSTWVLTSNIYSHTPLKHRHLSNKEKWPHHKAHVSALSEAV